MISHIPAAPNPFPTELVIYNYDTTIFTFFKDFSTLLDRKIILLPRPGSRLGKHLDKQKFYLRRQKIYGSFLIFPKGLQPRPCRICYGARCRPDAR